MTKKRTPTELASEIEKELLTCGTLNDYGNGCGRKLTKYDTGIRIIWSCPKCGEMGDAISDEDLQRMKKLLTQVK